jgi:hypothetical protein
MCDPWKEMRDYVMGDGLNVIALLFIGSLNVQKSPRLEAVIKE